MLWQVQVFSWEWRSDGNHKNLRWFADYRHVRAKLYGNSDGFGGELTYTDGGTTDLDHLYCYNWKMWGRRILIEMDEFIYLLTLEE